MGEQELATFYSGRRILITGGTGSIGSEIVRQLLRLGPSVLRIFSRDETKQAYLREEMGPVEKVRFLIGDVRDRERLRLAMDQVDVVFHAAALKHVPSCEYNPFEAVQTNVLGTQNLLQAAHDAGVGFLVVISTDKAVNPVNTMGATKLLAERLVASAHNWMRVPRLACVRFGNVLGSRGSLLPLVRKQLSEGRAVTLTHPAMTRFMMTCQDAVRLVLKAPLHSGGGELFILKMPALRVRDLIAVVIEEHCALHGIDPAGIPVEELGLRAGEKLHESLLTEEEWARTREEDDLLVVDPRAKILRYPAPLPDAYDSARAPKIGRQEIRRLLERAGIVADEKTSHPLALTV